MFCMDGQTAGPNGLKFFRTLMGKLTTPGSSIFNNFSKKEKVAKHLRYKEKDRLNSVQSSLNAYFLKGNPVFQSMYFYVTLH